MTVMTTPTPRTGRDTCLDKSTLHESPAVGPALSRARIFDSDSANGRNWKRRVSPSRPSSRFPRDPHLENQQTTSEYRVMTVQQLFFRMALTARLMPLAA